MYLHICEYFFAMHEKQVFALLKRDLYYVSNI